MARKKSGKCANRGANAKGKAAPADFAGYLKGVARPARRALNQMRAVIRSAAPPGASETISYGIPAFKHNERVLVWYAAFSDHCSLFPTASVIEMLKNDLKDFSKSKGTVHFPLNEPLPVALIKKIVKTRAQQTGKKKRA